MGGVAKYLACHLISSGYGVHLFDCYREWVTRAAPAQDLLGAWQKKNAADFVLTLDSPLPPHSLSLKVSQNKVQLISFITAKLWEPIKQLLSRNQSILVSGLDNEPLKMSTSDLGPAKNATLRNCNMEVDMIMIQHVVDCTTRKPDAVIRAQCTDKDGFLLLHNIQHSLGISAVMMVHQSQNETHWHWPMCRWAKRHYNFAVTAWDIRLRHSQQN